MNAPCTRSLAISVQRCIAAVAVGAGLLITTAEAAGQDRFQQTNLVSNDQTISGVVQFDSRLINPWGLIRADTGSWFVINGQSAFAPSDTSFSQAGIATSYTGDGVIDVTSINLPAPRAARLQGQAFTGVFNPFGESRQIFVVRQLPISSPAQFIFAGQNGAISGWSPVALFPQPTENAQLLIGDGFFDGQFTGAAIDVRTNNPRLLLTDFQNGRVVAFDSQFRQVNLGSSAFRDSLISSRLRPVNIVRFDNRFIVAFAERDDNDGLPVVGNGRGAVTVFDADGRVLTRLTGEQFNAPVGVARAPRDFGDFSNAILVSNFGDGRILAFDADTGKFIGAMRDPNGRVLRITGIRSIAFGNDDTAGPSNTLFFTASPDLDDQSLFGRIDLVEQ